MKIDFVNSRMILNGCERGHALRDVLRDHKIKHFACVRDIHMHENALIEHRVKYQRLSFRVRFSYRVTRAGSQKKGSETYV